VINSKRSRRRPPESVLFCLQVGLVFAILSHMCEDPNCQRVLAESRHINSAF